METVLQQADCASLCPCASPCPIGDALSLVGGKWKPRLICTLYVDGTQRFNDLLKKTRGIPAAMLTMIKRSARPARMGAISPAAFREVATLSRRSSSAGQRESPLS